VSAPQPKGGYGANSAKTRWRHVAFQFSDWNAHESKKRDRVVACLESAEGLEVRHALELGYAPDHIHAFNTERAVLANMTRGLDRDGLPRVHVHTRSIAEAASIVGPVDILSLDFCGPATPSRLSDIHRAAAALRHGSVVMINVEGGRERDTDRNNPCFTREPIDVFQHMRRGLNSETTRFPLADAQRIQWIVNAVSAEGISADRRMTGCRWMPAARRVGRYLSGRLPYVWTAFQVATCDGSYTRRRFEEVQRLAAYAHAHTPAVPLGELEALVFLKQTRLMFPFRCACDQNTWDPVIDAIVPALAAARMERGRC
jgi:hypothetical protein